MTVFATAGHVKHGKTTLVAALTGRPGDRLEVRNQRARTIDLGFAPMTLPDGEQVSVVDVPGHESYVNNAIDGILPASARLLVVSAKEGWSQQTEQHAKVLAAVQDKPVLLVVTQADRCDPGPVLEFTRQRLATLDIHPVWQGAVSGATGQGLPGLLPKSAGADTKLGGEIWVESEDVDGLRLLVGYESAVAKCLVRGNEAEQQRTLDWLDNTRLSWTLAT